MRTSSNRTVSTHFKNPQRITKTTRGQNRRGATAMAHTPFGVMFFGCWYFGWLAVGRFHLLWYELCYLISLAKLQIWELWEKSVKNSTTNNHINYIRVFRKINYTFSMEIYYSIIKIYRCRVALNSNYMVTVPCKTLAERVSTQSSSGNGCSLVWNKLI